MFSLSVRSNITIVSYTMQTLEIGGTGVIILDKGVKGSFNI